MSDQSAVMFTRTGLPTPYLLNRWRAKGGLQQPQINAVYVQNGEPRPIFRSLWAKAFPAKPILPRGPVVTQAGTFTDTMLDVWLA